MIAVFNLRPLLYCLTFIFWGFVDFSLTHLTHLSDKLGSYIKPFPFLLGLNSHSFRTLYFLFAGVKLIRKILLIY